MINILKEIDENATMKDMVINLINNIEFYIEHRNKLADIHLTNEYLSSYLKELYDILELYNLQKIPNWFLNYKPSRFLSADFPYNKPLMDWCFSFKEMIEIVLSQNENIELITFDKLSLNGKIITAEEWRLHKTLTY